MSPLASIFGAAIAARNALYDHRLLVARRLRGPVISVGNISVGGTGKTPFVIMLGELLKQRGISFDVLSRGYRRKTSGVLMVDPQGTPRDYGDEPLLIARKLRVPVFVGESRYLAGLASEHRSGPQLHLLDDGFQHRQLARDYDIVLVTPDDANGRLLPTGRQREPISALRRADAVVLTPGTSPSGLPLAGKLVLQAHRGIDVGDAPKTPIAFCAIGRPDQFFRQLRESNLQTAAEITFRDHHSYTEADVANLRAAATKNGADGFITTEKDAVNIGPLAAQLEPLCIVRAIMTVDDANTALDAILAKIAERRGTLA